MADLTLDDIINVDTRVEGPQLDEIDLTVPEPELAHDKKTVRIGDTHILVPQVGSKIVGRKEGAERAENWKSRKLLPGGAWAVQRAADAASRDENGEYKVGVFGRLMGLVPSDVEHALKTRELKRLQNDFSEQNELNGNIPMRWGDTEAILKDRWAKFNAQKGIAKKDAKRFLKEKNEAIDAVKKEKAEITKYSNKTKGDSWVNRKTQENNNVINVLAALKQQEQISQWNKEYEYKKANDLRNRADTKDSNALQIQLKQMEIDDSQQRYERDMEFYRAEKLQQELSNGLGYLMMLFN